MVGRNFFFLLNLFLQIRGWKAWEAETQTNVYEFAYGMSSNNAYGFLLYKFFNFTIKFYKFYYICVQMLQDLGLLMKHHS